MIDAQPQTELENLAAKDAARFKAKYDWVDETAVETHISVSNTYAAVMNAFGRCLEGNGETRGHGRNRILRLIYLSRPERLAQGEIGRELSVTSANVTYLIDGLVRDGLVERVVNPVDRRVTFVELTPSGEELVQRLIPVIGEFMAAVSKELRREERVTLNDLLNRLRISAEHSFQTP